MASSKPLEWSGIRQRLLKSTAQIFSIKLKTPLAFEGMAALRQMLMSPYLTDDGHCLVLQGKIFIELQKRLG